MRNFLCFIVLLFVSFLNAQFLKVEYNRINLSGFNNNNFSDEFKKIIKEKSMEPSQEILYYANGNSFYKTFPKDPIERVKSRITEGNTTNIQRERYVNKETKIYHIKGDVGVYQYLKYGDEEFYHKDNLKFEKIDYKSETQIIEKYICNLVEITMNNGLIYKIWYTENLPISSGPLGFVNFPGLVLKIEAPSFVIYAIKISNETKESDVEKVNPRLKIYTGKEFEDKMIEIRKKASIPTKTEIRL